MSKIALASKVRPLGDRVLVERIAAEEKHGDLYIPEGAKEKSQEGTVLSAGPGRRLENGDLIPLNVTETDHILFGKYSGVEINIDGKELLLLREDEILAVLE